jgi:hypothetical protein
MMTTDPIIESGLTFGMFPEGACFYIEKSKTYQQIQEGVKMAEFILLRQNEGKAPTIWVIEAKSSAPQPSNSLDFDKYIEEIRSKLTNALTLAINICLKRHPDGNIELSQEFKQLDLTSVNFLLILVINNFQEAWLPPLQDALAKALRPTIKIWALSPPAVLVLNEDGAKRKNLII